MTNVDLFDSFEQDEDFDSDLSTQHQYLFSMLDQLKKLDRERKLSRADREALAEERRIQGVRRMLCRPVSQKCGSNDESDLYKLLTKYDGAINTVIDGLGNTAAHWVTNLNFSVKKTISDEHEIWHWETATRAEREARESWLDVVVSQCKPNVTIKNNSGFSPLDYACNIGPSMVLFLCQNSDISKSERRKAIARSYIIAATGYAEETCEAQELYQAIVDLGYDINAQSDMVVAGSMITQDTFKEVIKASVEHPNPYMSQECFKVLSGFALNW